MNQEFSCSDKETLIAYIYGECEADDRQRIEAHLATCAACAGEVAGVASVRESLAAWTPTAAAPGFRLVREADEVPKAPATVLRPGRWWRQPLPVWARAAAAVLLFAGGAALANLDVHYGNDGLTVRTGWQHASAVQQAQAPAQGPQVVPAYSAGSAPWRGDLVALEQQLRGDFGAQLQALRVPVSQPASRAQDGVDRQVMTRVRAMIDESEQRQQREMAYRISQVQGEFGVQRRADLLRVQAGLGQIQGQTGEEVMRQRQLINYLLASQKR